MSIMRLTSGKFPCDKSAEMHSNWRKHSFFSGPISFYNCVKYVTNSFGKQKYQTCIKQ